MAAYGVGNPELIEVDGKPSGSTPQQSLGLRLVLHELGTNAVKYGALSDHHGRVRVSWQKEQQEDGAQMRLIWQERDGPSVTPPSRQGFGSKLIEQVCNHQLGGKVERQYAPEGLRCEIVFPLS